MLPLTECFEIGQREVVTAIGSGGKTSLIWHLAQAHKTQKVLVTTTTKFYEPVNHDHTKPFDRLCEGGSLPLDRAPPGVTLAGLREPGGKLKSLPEEVLRQVLPLYQKVLIEGDGSRARPMKAWESYEPVVPEGTTLTVGIVPLWQVGGQVGENLVHRLPLFTRLTGAEEGDTLTLAHVAAVLAGRAGEKSLFTAARGRRAAFLNQIESPEELAVAIELFSLLPEGFLQELDLLVAGSVRLGAGEVLWRKKDVYGPM